MTDEPATTPADRVTALTLRCGQLREQRDEALAQVVALRAENAEAWKLYTQATTDAYGVRVLIAVLHQPTDADECPVCTTEDGMSYASPCPTLRAVRAPGGAGSAHRAETGAPAGDSVSPDLLGPQIGAEPTARELKLHQIIQELIAERTRADALISNTLAGVVAVEAVVAPWPPGVRKGDVLRAIGGVE